MESNLFISFERNEALLLYQELFTNVVLSSSYDPGPGTRFFYSLLRYDLPNVAEGDVFIFEVLFHWVSSLDMV
jgi:hypothetical protein